MSQSPTSRTASASRVEEDRRSSRRVPISVSPPNCPPPKPERRTKALRVQALVVPHVPSFFSAGCSSTACNKWLSLASGTTHVTSTTKFWSSSPTICECCEWRREPMERKEVVCSPHDVAFPGFARFSPFEAATSRCPWWDKGKPHLRSAGSGKWARLSHTMPAGSTSGLFLCCRRLLRQSDVASATTGECEAHVD
jgi:hypothetical protein